MGGGGGGEAFSLLFVVVVAEIKNREGVCVCVCVCVLGGGGGYSPAWSGNIYLFLRNFLPPPTPYIHPFYLSLFLKAALVLNRFEKMVVFFRTSTQQH